METRLPLFTSVVFSALLAFTGCSSTYEYLPQTVYQHRMKNSDFKANVAILIASDTGRKHKAEAAARKFVAKGHRVIDMSHLPNEETLVEEQLKSWVAQDVDVIICIGGTGLASRDNTVNALDKVIDMDIPGFGELFRYLTYMKWGHVSDEMGVLAMDTRAKAGKAKNTVIFAVPGSPDAVQLALDKLIIPDIPHLVAHTEK